MKGFFTAKARRAQSWADGEMGRWGDGGWGMGDGGSTFQAELDWKLWSRRWVCRFLNILDDSDRVEAQRFWHYSLGSFLTYPAARLDGFNKYVANSKQSFVARSAMARKASRKRCSPSRNPPVSNTALNFDLPEKTAQAHSQP